MKLQAAMFTRHRYLLQPGHCVVCPGGVCVCATQCADEDISPLSSCMLLAVL
jgi:hypothetical protein